jgi:hypothetical protein
MGSKRHTMDKGEWDGEGGWKRQSEEEKRQVGECVESIAGYVERMATEMEL